MTDRHVCRSALRIALAALLLVGAAGGRLVAQNRWDTAAPSADGPARVDKDRLVVTFPLPYRAESGGGSPAVGHYVWRLTVEDGSGFSIVLMADSAMRSTDAADIVRASSLRLCEGAVATSALACTRPVAGTASVANGIVSIDVRDADVVARLRRERPPRFWRYVHGPDGRFQMDQQTFAYDVK